MSEWTKIGGELPSKIFSRESAPSILANFLHLSSAPSISSICIEMDFLVPQWHLSVDFIKKFNSIMKILQVISICEQLCCFASLRYAFVTVKNVTELHHRSSQSMGYTYKEI